MWLSHNPSLYQMPLLEALVQMREQMRDTLIDLVENHNPIDDLEKDYAVKTLSFLRENDNCTSSDNLVGHITASAWVLSPSLKETLLTHHKKLGRWLQLGGHIENDSTIQKAALREAIEESGIGNIVLLEKSIFDIDVHKIPTRKNIAEHYHYDLRFLFQAEQKEFVVSSESNNLSWVKLDNVGALVQDESILRMCRKSNHLL